MILASLTLSLIREDLPSVNDVLQHCNTRLASSQNYADTWKIESSSEGEKNVFEFQRKLAGIRWAYSISMNGEPLLETASDGTWSITVMHTAKKYSKEPVKDTKRKPDELPEVEENSFTFNLKDHAIVMRANPDFKTSAFRTDRIEDKTLRYLRAETTRTDGAGSLSLDLWLDEKDWVVRRFDVTKTKDGKAERVLHAIATTCDLSASFLDADFSIPESKYAGYEQVPGGLPLRSLYARRP